MRTAFLCIATVLFCAVNLSAQQQIGVVWSIPSDNQQALNELDRFAKLGVTLLIVDTSVKEEGWNRIDSLDFNVYGNLPIKYPIVSTFANPDSSLLEQISKGVNQLIAQPSVQSIGIFSLGQAQSARFKEAIQPMVQQIDTATTAELFYTTLFAESVLTDSLFHFKLLKIKDPESLKDSISMPKVKGYVYDAQNKLLSPVKTLLEQAKSDSIPVFFTSNWLLTTTQNNPEFEEALRHYTTTKEVVFPLPEEAPPSETSHNLIVVLLLLILGTFVMNYQYSPVYKKTIARYFLAHKFLVNDVMDRHIRTISPALVILFQHIIAVGIVAYCLGTVAISEAGWQAVQYHYSEFFISKSPLISLFFGGCIFGLAIHLFSIFWIRLTNKKVTHFSQVILLYSWPLQLNFVLTLLITTLMLSSSLHGLIYVLSIAFVIIFLGAFIITSFDTSNYLTSRRIGFLLASIGLYSVIWIALITWMLSSPHFLDVLNLASSLP
ncbi:MAG: hypothetical protein U5J95_06655 [Balneolaceae bacterium]|nr:hypothetical protein [Balneolaceae bacterium]